MLQLLDRLDDPQPHRPPVHVALLEHGVGLHGGVDRGLGAVLRGAACSRRAVVLQTSLVCFVQTAASDIRNSISPLRGPDTVGWYMQYRSAAEIPTLVATGRERLERLATFLDVLPPDRLTFSRWYGQQKVVRWAWPLQGILVPSAGPASRAG